MARKTSNGKAFKGTITKQFSKVEGVGDLLVRFGEIDSETYDDNSEASRIRLRISNNGQRLETFKLAFRAGALKMVNGQLMLVGATD